MPMKLIRHALPAPKWPSYTGASQFSGTSTDGRVNVWYDPSLGTPGAANAAALVKDAARVTGINDAIFGTVGGYVNVIIFALGGVTDGTGGADHNGCDYWTGQNIEVCAAFGEDMMCSALFEAELSECSMNNNLCGLSTGEALSRWCANKVGGNALAPFASGPVWAQDGMPDFVTKTDQTDGDYDSIGCGMAFLSWLQSLGHPLSKIAPAMVKLGNSGTLSELYFILTGLPLSNALAAFMTAVKVLPNGVTSDDPFGGVVPIPAPVPVPTPVPTPVPPPTPVPVPPGHPPHPPHGSGKIKADLLAIEVLLDDIAANIVSP